MNNCTLYSTATASRRYKFTRYKLMYVDEVSMLESFSQTLYLLMKSTVVSVCTCERLYAVSSECW